MRLSETARANKIDNSIIRFNVLRSTFIFLPGVKWKTEEAWWHRRITSWKTLQDNFSSLGFDKKRRKRMTTLILAAEGATEYSNAEFFQEILPQSDYWRLYKEFRQRTVFLDIETTGLSIYYDKITEVGAYADGKVKFFLRGVNLQELPEFLGRFNIIVTFNGKLFDIPFLKRELPEVRIPPIHIDLRFALKSIGIKGRLKGIEQKLGLSRPEEIRDIGGRNSVLLWNDFLGGDDRALERYLLYNSYDVINLQKLMDYLYNQKALEVLSKIKANGKQVDLLGSSTFNLQDREMDSVFYLDPTVELSYRDDTRAIVSLNGNEILEFDRRLFRRKTFGMQAVLDRIRKKGYIPSAVGIDLTGSTKKATGFCTLEGTKAYLETILTDEEMIERIKEVNPEIVSIDSPLSLPRGRHCTRDDCWCRKYGITRECERILKKRGVNVYPALIKSMQKLTERGIKLKDELESLGFKVIESYPGAAQDILGIPRKRVSLTQLEQRLRSMGIVVTSKELTANHDELDAFTSALVGYLYMAGNYEQIGNTDEGYLIIPSIDQDTT